MTFLAVAVSIGDSSVHLLNRSCTTTKIQFLRQVSGRGLTESAEMCTMNPVGSGNTSFMPVWPEVPCSPDRFRKFEHTASPVTSNQAKSSEVQRVPAFSSPPGDQL